MVFVPKIGIGCGAALLIFLMVLGAFSLGVVVGNRGLLMGTVQDFGTRPGVGQQPPQPPTGPGQQPPEGPELQLPAGKPALVGRVGAITNEGLFLQTPQGPRLVEVEKETGVQDQRGQELSLSDLRQGMHVAIFGEFSRDGRRLTAENIIVLPPPQP
jgi:hypothetical protein